MWENTKQQYFEETEMLQCITLLTCVSLGCKFLKRCFYFKSKSRKLRISKSRQEGTYCLQDTQLVKDGTQDEKLTIDYCFRRSDPQTIFRLES